MLSLVSGQARTPEEIGNIAVKTTAAGLPVRIGDVAAVVESVRPVYTVVTANGKPAVLLNVNRQPDGNTVRVADEVHAEVASIRKSLPRGVDLQPFYDQSEIVNDSITSVRDAILIGLILASIIMVVFLRDWGTSLVAGLVIPATVAVTFITLRIFGETFNLMTMGGLAAAVGLVIDDAIVVVENIVLHRDAGESRADAIRNAIREIRKPLVGSTITPIVVFLPLISITGVTGVFFRALAITVGMAVLTSLVFALTWTPTLSHFFIRQRRASSESDAPKPREGAGLMGRLVRAYEWVLRRALAHPIVLTVMILALVGGSYFCYQAVGSDLLPPMDEGGFILDYLTPAGASLAETNRVMTEVDSILHAIPEVQNTSRRTGLAARPGAGHRSQQRRLHREAQTGPDSQFGRGYLRGAGQDHRALSKRGVRVRPVAAGHDRRSDQRARAGRDQAVLAGSRRASRMGAEAGREYREDPGCG